MENIALQVAGAVLFVIATFAILSRRVNDGILGKLCWAFLSLSGISIALSSNPIEEARRNVIAMVAAVLLVVIREMVLIIVFKRGKKNAANIG